MITFFPPKPIIVPVVELVSDTATMAKFDSLESIANYYKDNYEASLKRERRLLQNEHERNKQIDAYDSSDVRRWLDQYQPGHRMRDSITYERVD